MGKLLRKQARATVARVARAIKAGDRDMMVRAAAARHDAAVKRNPDAAPERPDRLAPVGEYRRYLTAKIKAGVAAARETPRAA